ncbi:E3 ubiquitin-protein ligase PDZRN3 [Sinocyclocheilus anshuiensis]|uniref:E3 ubiquitin-protein ligase PDZRN3 n=1 Tax=Sinocyclocheilus anshuiensis TaxID=1608454 RepID=UPI0007BA3642|nr:PREDICTED: E3 ubiquitin-protein ligase PDZRN3-like [Sinocyclocheilus anshuiensis]
MGCRLSGPWMGDGMGVHGQDLTHLQKREAFRILASYEQPITLQIEGRGRSLQYNRTTDCSTQTERPWDPLRPHSCTLPRLPPSDRTYYNHMTLPGTHRDGSRYEYLPNTPRDLEHRERLAYKDHEFSSGVSPAQNCLIGCCNTNLEEPRSFQSQTDDDDYMMEKPLGYLPLHHELDSGLGWTDGSFHQGELSGVETEEGLEERHGRSPSSESFISSELSDSGFYSVSTGEFLRFQRLLEKRMRHYNARMHHQGEPCSRERRDSQIKHPLEAIPETLTVQPQNVCTPVPGSRGLSRVSSVQYRKVERPCLNRHSSSSGSLFNPALYSTCSMPSSQRRLPPHPSSAGMLRRSRTLHHRPAPMEYRRRASHPASPNYCSGTQHPCGHRVDLPMNLPEEPALMHTVSHPAHPVVLPTQTLHATHAMSQPSLISPFDEHCYMPPELHDNSRIRASTEPQLQKSFVTQQTPNNRFHTLSHTPSQDANDTWPKPANRAGSGGGGGLYSTLEGHTPTAAIRKPSSGNLRALRNQMLRDRASRLADERSGMSTDEESHSEVRMGRYWSRTERREHMLQKQRQLQARSGGGGGVAASGLVYSGEVVGGTNGDSCSTLLELSQRKLSRLRNRKLLDDWTTVEELLTHGTRLGPSGDTRQLPTSLLTVTTV